MKKIYSVILVLSLLFVGCTKNKSKSTLTNKSTNSYNQANEARFIDAMGFYHADKFEDALNKFQICYETQPNEPGLNYMISRTYFKLKQYDKSLKYANAALQLDPKNIEYYVLSAENSKKLNKLQDLESTYKAMFKNTKGAEEYLYDLYEAQMYERKYADALKTMDDIQAYYGPNEALINEKLKLYIKLSKFEEAEKELKFLIAENPQEVKYRHSLVKFYLERNQIDKAENQTDSTLLISPSDPIATMLKYEIFKQKGQLTEAENFLDKIFSNPKINIDTKVEFVLSMFKGLTNNAEKQSKLINYTNDIIKTNPENAKSYALAGDVNSYSDKKKDAIANYKKSLKIDPSKNIVWVQLVLLELQNNELDSVIANGLSAQELFPVDSRFPYFVGTAYYQKKDYNAAVKYLKQAQALTGEESDVKDNTRSTLADCYFYLKEYEKSDMIFEELLKENPQNYSAMNNYCYFLSLRKEKLEYAKEMGLKVAKAFPDEPTYLDTYGWVLFVNKDYKEAEIYLGKAAKNSNNGTIVEHYGDVLFQLGEVDKALQMWQKAKLTGEASDLIDKKIKDKKYYE